MSANVAELSRRGVVAVSGADAAKFLNDLMTSDMPPEGAASYGALLSPQGKVLFDFIAFRDGGTFLFDLPWGAVDDFAKRLGFYKLRAKVDVEVLRDRRVIASWGEGSSGVPDPRLAELGFRAIVQSPVKHSTCSEAEYDAHRIALGVPEGGVDFAYGDAFPHDADMDQLGGVDFKKGCYVGQEVVSRMEHRGTARRRFVIAHGPSPLPEPGTAITAGEKPIGTLGSSAGGTALALVRLDRAKEAIDAGTQITAGDAALVLTLPAWATFAWPTSAAVDE